MRKTIMLMLISAMCAGAAAAQEDGAEAPPDPQRERLEEGIDLYRGREYAKAVDIFKKLAAAANPLAEYYYADCLDHGFGVAQSTTQAAEIYGRVFPGVKALAAEGYPVAQNALGLMYESGESVEENAEEAAAWYGKAAEQGYAAAQYNLADCYARGAGVYENQSEAYNWFQRAAEQEYPQAQYALGAIYAAGTGVEADLNEAASWYEKAANQGYVKAQTALGLMYLKGEGMPDTVKGAAWLMRAADQGDAEAKEGLAAHAPWWLVTAEGNKKPDSAEIHKFHKQIDLGEARLLTDMRQLSAAKRTAQAKPQLAPVAQAEQNCRLRSGCPCYIEKGADGKLAVMLAMPLRETCSYKLDGESDGGLADLWAGVFGYGLTANHGYTMYDYSWGPPGRGLTGVTEKGVDPALIRKLEIVIYDRRDIREKIDAYGKVISPARSEKKLLSKITFVPGDAGKFAWNGGHIHEVWENVVKAAEAARTVTLIDSAWK